jgi:WD40 repeat protein
MLDIRKWTYMRKLIVIRMKSQIFIWLLLGVWVPVAAQISNDDILWTAEWNVHDDQIYVGGNLEGVYRIETEFSAYEKAVSSKNTITNIKAHPNKPLLAISGQLDAPTLILNTETDERIFLDKTSSDGARGLDWNRDGSLLAVGDNDGNLLFFGPDGQFVRKIQTDLKAITSVSWHPFKNTIVAVGSQILLYDYESDSVTYQKHRREDVLMLAVDWHPSGRYFTTADYGDHEKNICPVIQFWSSELVITHTRVEKCGAEIRNVEWNSNGTVLAATSGKLQLFNIELKPKHTYSSANLLWGLSWNAEDTKLVTTDEMGNVFVFDRELKLLNQTKL